MQGSNESSPIWITKIKINRDYVLLAIIILIGTLFRFLRFFSVRHGVLDPDAIGYRFLAMDFLQGSDNLAREHDIPPREPVFPLMLAAVFMVFGSGIDTLRLTTLLLSIFMIPLTYRIGKEAFCSSCGLLASFLVATNYFLIYNSPRGLREELFADLILILLFFSFTAGENEENYSKAAFSAILLCLTKFEGFLIVLATVIWLGWHARLQGRRMPRRKISAILFTLILSFLFFLIHGILVFGEPFASSKSMGSWFYWYEFASHETTYLEQGISISMLEYLFVHHSPRELLQGVILGLIRLTESDLFGITYFWPILLMLGILLASINDRGVYLAISLVFVVPFLAFFYYVGGNIRLFYNFFPIFSVLMSKAAFRVYQSVLPYFNNLDTFHRLFATGIFCFVVLRYVYINLIRHTSGIYSFVLAGFVLFMFFFCFYHQGRSEKSPP